MSQLKASESNLCIPQPSASSLGSPKQVSAKAWEALDQTPSGSRQPSDEVYKVKQNILNALSENEDVESLLTEEICKGLKERASQLENNPDCMAEMLHVDQALLITEDPKLYGYASADVQKDQRVLKYMIRNAVIFKIITEEDSQGILKMIDANRPVDEIWKCAAENYPRFVLMHGPDALKMDVKIICSAMAQLEMDTDSLHTEPKPTEPSRYGCASLKGTRRFSHQRLKPF